MQRTTFRRRLTCELLESRLLLSGSRASDPDIAEGDAPKFRPVIVAGDPNGTPPDSPAQRVDVNSATSPFAGVGSLRISASRGTYICTATPIIDSTHLLTAAHCLDINNDGRSDRKDGIRSVTFNLNTDVDAPTDQIDVQLAAASWTLHPHYTGFNRPSINDDLAIVTLSVPVPAGLPVYELYTGSLSGATIDMVGYGRTGTGVSGYSGSASFTVKRHGQNVVDAFYGQDDSGQPSADEVFRFDFDGPTGTGQLGGATLGNDVETTLGGGDSGGPSFVFDGSYKVAGVNTFTQGSAPYFGSLGGGMAVPAYAAWIETTVAGSTAASSTVTTTPTRLIRTTRDSGADFVPVTSVAYAAPLHTPADPAHSMELPAVRDESELATGATASIDPNALQSTFVTAEPVVDDNRSQQAIDELLDEWALGLDLLDGV